MTPNAVRAAVAPAPRISTPWARIKRVLPFLGPAFVASVAYMDPGNFATNIQAGADFGYMLLWVLVVSNLMAILIQSLSAKLGIASGLTLPQAIRANTTRRMRIGLWLAAEAAAMATDLADQAAAERLLARNARSLARVADPRQRRQRAYALLARKGFDPEVCRTVAASVMDEPPEAGHDVEDD